MQNTDIGFKVSMTICKNLNSHFEESFHCQKDYCIFLWFHAICLR